MGAAANRLALAGGGSGPSWWTAAPQLGLATFRKGIVAVRRPYQVWVPEGSLAIKFITFIWFSAVFRPDLAPRPVPTGRARKMVQNEPKSDQILKGNGMHGIAVQVKFRRRIGGLMQGTNGLHHPWCP